VIVLAHAVIYPGAVMVEAVHAPVADVAVTGSLISDYIALWAELAEVFVNLKQLYKVQVRSDIPRVHLAGKHEEHC
jgi:hypothetical protein